MNGQKLQAKISKWLKQKGFWSVTNTSVSKTGTPDITACAPDGVFIGIEVKGDNDVITLIQEYQIKQINDRGGIAFEARSLQEVMYKLRAYK